MLTEVALKVLEPIDPSSLSTCTSLVGSARAALEAFASKWKNDALENCARSYSTARQELNMLAETRHPHVTSLMGFSTCPMTLIVELVGFLMIMKDRKLAMTQTRGLNLFY